MQTSDFFRSRIDAMINLNDPLGVLATRLSDKEVVQRWSENVLRQG